MTGVRQDALGAELRRIRKGAKLSLEALAERCGWSHSKLSRIETGKVAPSVVDVGIILGVCNVVGPARQYVIDLAEGLKQQRWWEVGSPGLPRQLSSLIDYEQSADEIIDAELALIPGLLQTDAIARFYIEAWGRTDETDDKVSIRLGRQGILSRANPPRFTAFLDESVLYREIAPPEVMAEQFRRMVQIGGRRNVDLRVLRLSSPLLPAMGTFRIMRLPQARDIVYLEHKSAAVFLDAADEVQPYLDAVPTLHKNAMSSEESLDLLTRCAEEMEARCATGKSG